MKLPLKNIWHLALRLSTFCGLVTLLDLVGCQTRSERNKDFNLNVNASSNQSTQPTALFSATDSCLAIRGNGPRIFAHFEALGKYHEHYPPVRGLAGSSSGSITSFLYESMMLNPLVTQCEDKPCDPREQAIRLSFLFKSLFVYGEVFFDSDEIKSLRYVFDIVNSLKSKTFDSAQFLSKIKDNPSDAWSHLEEVLSGQEIRPYVNGEVFKLIRESQNKIFHLQETQKALQSFGNFKANNISILLFPGFVNWSIFAERIGRIGDFYAGYGNYYPRSDMEEVVKRCAKPVLGQSWQSLKTIPYSPNETCAQKIASTISYYRTRKIKDTRGPRRVDEKPGKSQSILISTSLIEGDTKIQFAELYGKYLAGSLGTWKPDYQDIKVGYFASPVQASHLTEKVSLAGSNSGKIRILSDFTWKDILRTSPAEPGLSGLQTLKDGSLSAGGWIDLTPVMALKALGCQNTVLLTRPIGAINSNFASGMVSILGGSVEDVKGLVGSDFSQDPPSSFVAALKAADAVMCADWDSPPASAIQAIAQSGRDAVFYSQKDFWTLSKDRHPGVQPKAEKEICIKK